MDHIKYNVSFLILVLGCVVSCSAGSVVRAVYSSGENITYFFDGESGMAWDVDSHYGIPFQVKKFSGVECVEFDERLVCAFSEKRSLVGGVYIDFVGDEVVVLGDGSSVNSISYDVSRGGVRTRVFSAVTGEIVAFSIFNQNDEWDRYVARDIGSAFTFRQSSK